MTWTGLGEIAKDVGGLRIGNAFNRLGQMIWNTKGMVDASNSSTLIIKEIMKIIYYCILIFILSGCRNSQKKHLRTIDICRNESKLPCSKLYVEVFSDLAVGLPGSDLTYDYLTDSSSFKLFMGKYDYASEILTADIIGDSIIIIKSTNEGQSPEWQSPKIIEKKVYSLNVLQEKGKFE